MQKTNNNGGSVVHTLKQESNQMYPLYLCRVFFFHYLRSLCPFIPFAFFLVGFILYRFFDAHAALPASNGVCVCVYVWMRS